MHRKTLIDALPEEQKPIAEELFKGGIPAVRAALDSLNEEARKEGRPEISPEPLVALAERMWPQVRAAEWRDRADAALADAPELDLRDLRSVVVAADSAARDDESRELAAKLRETLTKRVEEEHHSWLMELAELVSEGRIVAALRRSARPPKAGSPVPAELAVLLIEKSAEALTAETATDRWTVMLDALSFSPVRNSVIPLSIPAEPTKELLDAVVRFSSRLPHIAGLFGVEATAPPSPGRRAGGGGASRGAGGARGPRNRGDRGPSRTPAATAATEPAEPTAPTATSTEDTAPVEAVSTADDVVPAFTSAATDDAVSATTPSEPRTSDESAPDQAPAHTDEATPAPIEPASSVGDGAGDAPDQAESL